MSKLRVGIMFGGRSSEHSISCATAAGVLGAIDRSKYEVVPIGVTREGVFVPAVDDASRWALTDGPLPEVVYAGARLDLAIDGSRRLTEVDSHGRSHDRGVIDLVFPVLHGPYGEDGTIQGLFELAGLPYVGNGVFASAAGMDKEFSKALFLQAGIQATPHVVVHKARWMADPETCIRRMRDIGAFPWFVKPARAGSSMGVSKVNNIGELGAAVAKAFEQDVKLTVERGLIGREVEVAVLSARGYKPARVSVAGEIVVKGREFYDFDAKYRDEQSVDLIIPAEMLPVQLNTIHDLARRAFEAIGGRGLARVDFFLTANGFFINEINTMPGFTPLSMYPKLWEASGVTYVELIDELIYLALESPE